MESRRRCVWNSAEQEWNQHGVLYFGGALNLLSFVKGIENRLIIFYNIR